jgi:hypothetical protein
MSSSLTYSQIWLRFLVEDCQPTYLTILGKTKHWSATGSPHLYMEDTTVLGKSQHDKLDGPVFFFFDKEIGEILDFFFLV